MFDCCSEKKYDKDGVIKPASFYDYEITLDALDGVTPEIFDMM